MLKLIMVIHCHQPVGNFDHVFRMGLSRCYLPILNLLNDHPSVKVGIHFSGPLLEWMEQNRSGGLDLLAAMVERGQIEMLSGGFFEPLLATIPVRDAKGQVLMMNDYISRRFGQRPTGFWLAERVWDPGLPKILEGTGMSYTIVDDTHLYYAGLRPHEIYGVHITEKEGFTMNLLATPMVMRYLIPFKPVEDVINHLRTQAEMGNELAVYGDDGEKFGLWPGTYEWVIEKGWLERFLSAIEENSDWLQTELPGDFVSASSPLGRLYLPQASYEEMTEWALPPERAHTLEEIIKTLKNEGRWDEWRPFVRGGVWDNFLVKYDESNRMHKKMLFISDKSADNGEAREHLWRAQCNCAYWHGVFGGLYLGHLRRAIYENLIRAQECLIRDDGNKINMLLTDLDKDGHEEVLLWGPDLSLGLAPARGGGLFEICHIPSRMNLCDTLTRRAEAYHHEVRNSTGTGQGHDREGIPSIHDMSKSGDEDLASLLIYDTYTRISLLDHFLGPETTINGYAANDYHEHGDFVTGRYGVEQGPVTPEGALVSMSRKGIVGESPLILKKEIQLQGNSHVLIDYLFENQGPGTLSTVFGCEFNLNLYSDQDPERYYFAPESGRRREVRETGSEDNLALFELINKADGLKFSFNFSSPLSVWFFPLMTVSKNEEGFEHTYQGTSLLFNLPLNIPQGQSSILKFNMGFVKL